VHYVVLAFQTARERRGTPNARKIIAIKQQRPGTGTLSGPFNKRYNQRCRIDSHQPAERAQQRELVVGRDYGSIRGPLHSAETAEDHFPQRQDGYFGQRVQTETVLFDQRRVRRGPMHLQRSR